MRPQLGGALAVCAAVVALLVGCGDDEESASPTDEASPSESAISTRAATASPAATATGTAQAESDGEDGFRVFAARVDAALASSDGGFFGDRGLEQDLVCTGEEQVGICTDQPPGTAFRGIPRGIFQTDAFALTSPEDYADDLVQWFSGARPELEDEYGSGAVALYATAYKSAGDGGEEAYQAIITAIVTSDPEPLRQALSLSFRFVDGRWRLTGEIAANLPQTADGWLSGGCEYCYDRWELWEGS